MFRSKKYLEHHYPFHPSQWALYKACFFDEKTRFFYEMIHFANTMLAHVNSGLAAAPLKFKIKAPIDDVLIGDMFFHPYDHEGTTRQTC
jgi:hypothetical protein